MAVGIAGEAMWKNELSGLRQLVLDLKNASKACLQAEVDYFQYMAAVAHVFGLGAMVVQSNGENGFR